ncbi:MAG: NAD-dependent epimerase/dehydratase family protein [Halobacteriales archaeon]
MDTVAVTGGNGKIGEAVLRELADRGYRAVNLARGKRREEVSEEYRTTDLLEAGEVYGSLAAADPDAVIHMGTIPAPTSHPGHVTYRSNAVSTYHVLEAAAGLGIGAVCLASSINVMGYDYQDAHAAVEYVPVDEAHPLTPRDPYAISKHALEVTADGFGRRAGPPHTIASLRYPWVARGDELRERYAARGEDLAALRAAWDRTGNDLFTYLHIADAAEVAVDAVEADLDGHEAFWAVAADTTTTVPTPELLDAFYPGADRRRELSGHDSLIDVGEAADLLDWSPDRSWRD